MTEDYWVCACFFSHNIFLQEYRLHVAFHEERQFVEDYKSVLEEKGCDSDEKLERVLAEVRGEVARRKDEGKKHLQRCKLVKEKYQQLHPSLYSISDSFFDPHFLEIVQYCQSPAASPDGLMELITEENAPNVFSFPVFSPPFCQQLLEELAHFERSNIPKGRPNTMNKSGILLSEMGFDKGFMNDFRSAYLMPIARLLYPEWVKEGLDSHKAFIVKYAIGDDVDLSYHFDNAEVTLNVCLGRTFHGGALYFGPMRGTRAPLHQDHTYEHIIGHGLLHRGRHMHGALPITEGERYNLIIWMRASSVRNKLCPMCNQPPQLVQHEGFGAGFTLETENYPVVDVCSIV